MRKKQNIGLIHFIGIGGIGMSAIAEILHDLGYKVQGSDAMHNGNIVRLQKKGIKIYIGHNGKNINGSQVVVASSAISENNVERVAARQKKIPIVRRAEMLAELMRFKQSIAVGGTHGKTTTTSIIGHILEQGGLDPTLINGGIVNSLGSNSRLGRGKWMVAEADESDGTFIKLPAEIAVVTNIDAEHLDYYGSVAKMKQAYLRFVENIPFYGCGILCIDNKSVAVLAKKIKDRKIVTFGNNKDSNFRFHHVRSYGKKSIFNITIVNKDKSKKTLKDLVLPMLGRYNVSNACAAIAVAWHLGLSEKKIRNALQTFKGVRRRFTFIAKHVFKGKDKSKNKQIEIFDDYGHHPVEIGAVLQAARQACKAKIIAIHQPHRYSRLQFLFKEFSKCFHCADSVFITPLYAANESPIKNINSQSLVKNIKKQGHKDVRFVKDIDSLATTIKNLANDGDYVIFLGAGDITNWANVLPQRLAKLK